MRAPGLSAKAGKKFKVTTGSAHSLPIAPKLFGHLSPYPDLNAHSFTIARWRLLPAMVGFAQYGASARQVKPVPICRRYIRPNFSRVELAC